MDLRTAKAILRGDDLRAEAERVLSARKRRRERGRPSREAREAKREGRNERLAVEVAAVKERSGGKCEWGDQFVSFPATEIHHLIGGGLRRHREDRTTLAHICDRCHRGYHEGAPWALRNAKEWAIRNGFREALRAIEHRIAKANEARTRQGDT